MTILDEIDRAILVDEIGMQSGRVEDYLLSTYYRPVFTRKEDALVPAAVHGIPAVQAGRTEVLGARQFAEVTERAGLALAAGTALMLQAGNWVPSDLGDLDLILDLDPSVIESLPAFAPRLRPDPGAPTFMQPPTGRILLGLPAAAFEDLRKLAILAVTLERNDFSALLGVPAYAECTLPVPVTVRIKGDMLRRLLRDPQARESFRQLTTVFRQRKVRLLVEEIRDVMALEAALAAGADLLAGDLLARPQAAGIDLERAERPLTSFMGEAGGPALPVLKTRLTGNMPEAAALRDSLP